MLEEFIQYSNSTCKKHSDKPPPSDCTVSISEALYYALKYISIICK